MRTATAPEDLVPSVREAVKTVDPTLPLAAITTLQQMVDRASAQMTFTMVLLAIAAVVSLILGVIGIYGVTSYIVSQRTAEIGVRLALGAEPRGITRQIVTRRGGVCGHCYRPGGGAGGKPADRVGALRRQPARPVVFVSMAIALQLVAVIACWLPARRAAALSPTIASRAE